MLPIVKQTKKWASIDHEALDSSLLFDQNMHPYNFTSQSFWSHKMLNDKHRHTHTHILNDDGTPTFYSKRKVYVTLTNNLQTLTFWIQVFFHKKFLINFLNQRTNKIQTDVLETQIKEAKKILLDRMLISNYKSWFYGWISWMSWIYFLCICLYKMGTTLMKMITVCSMRMKT